MIRPIFIAFALVLLTLSACATAGGGDNDLLPDAAGAGPDAYVPPMSDGMPPPPPPDAMPMIDAPPPCVDTTVQMLTSPGFDQNAADWNPSAGNIISPSGSLPGGLVPHSPDNVAWLGGVLSATRTIYQQITLPADARNVSVSFYRWIATAETDGNVWDTMTVSLQNASGGPLETLRTFSNLDANTGWTMFQYSPVGTYAGQTIRLHMSSTTDNAFNTNFFIDTASLTVLTCQ